MANYDFTDPSNQGRNVSREPFQIPQQDIDLSAVTRQEMEGISVLLNQLSTGFKDMGNLIETNLDKIMKSADGVQKIADSQKNANDATYKQIILREQQEQKQQKVLAAEKKINAEIDKGRNSIREQMREHGMYSRGRYQVPGRGRISASELDTILNDPNHPDRARILDQLRARAMGQALNSQGASPNFRVQDLATAVAHGDIGGIFRELSQGGPGRERFRSGLENLSGRLSSRGGLLGRLGGGIGGLAGSSAFEFLTTPAAAIAAIEIYRRGIRNVNQLRDIGAITGQGFEAGAQARFQATLQGLNPFDMISSRDALEAQMAVRQAGFTGGSANAAADLVTDLRQKLGLPVSESAQLVVTALRDTNMSLREARVELDSLHDAARNAGLSVKELATAAQTAMQTFAPLNRAAAQQALPNIEGLLNQYQGLVPRQTLGQLGSLVTPQTAQFLAMRMGLPSFEALNPQFFNQLPGIINRFILQLAQQKPADMDIVDYANYLFAAIPQIATMFAGTGPQGLADMMKAVMRITNQGRNPGALSRGQATAQAQTSALAAEQAYQSHLSSTPGRFGITGGQRLAAQAALNQIVGDARNMGLTADQISRVTAPIRQAIAAGGVGAEGAVEQAGRELGTIARHGHLTVAPSPSLERWFRFGVTGGNWNDVMRGRMGAQGVYRP